MYMDRVHKNVSEKTLKVLILTLSTVLVQP